MVALRAPFPGSPAVKRLPSLSAARPSPDAVRWRLPGAFPPSFPDVVLEILSELFKLLINKSFI